MSPKRRVPTALPALLVLLPACSGGEPEPTGSAPQPLLGQGPSGLVIRDAENPERPYFIQLGRVPWGEVVDREIHLENVESRPLTIRDVVPGCGCTLASLRFPGEDGLEHDRRMIPGAEPVVVPPGGRVTLFVRLDTTQVERAGRAKLVNVRIRTDSDRAPYLTIEISLTVWRPFQVTPPDVRLGQVPRSGVAEARVEVVTFEEDAPEIASIRSVPEGLEADLTRDDGLAVPVWRVVVRSVPPLEPGPLSGNLVLATTGPRGEGEGRDLVIPIRGTVTEDVVTAPTRLQFAPFAPGAEARARVEVRALLAGLRLRLVGARVEGAAAAHLAVELAPVAPDDLGRSSAWTVDLVALPGLAPGPFEGKVVLLTDDPARPELSVPYGGLLRG